MELNFTDAQHMSDISASSPLAASVPEWCRIVLLIYMSVVFITGTPGNTLVIFTQIKTKKKNTTDCFIIFLAISDMLTLVVSVPIYFSVMLNWWPTIGTTFGCRLHYCVIYLTFITQTIIIAEIAVDRIWKSKSVYQIFTPGKAFFSGIAAVGGSLVLSTAVAFTRHNNYQGECVRDNSKKLLQLVTYTISAVVIVVSVCTIAVAYIYILKNLKDRNKVRPGVTATTSTTNDMIPSTILHPTYNRSLRTTKMLFIVTLVYIILTLIPSIGAVVLVTSEFRNTVYGSIVLFFGTRLYLINSSANPIFYIWLNSTFRKRMCTLLKTQLC